MLKLLQVLEGSIEKRQQDISLCSPSFVKFKAIGNLVGALKIQSHSSVLALSASMFHSPAFAMEVLVSAVLGDLISRSISFAVDRCCHWRHEATVEDNLQRLRRVLLRIRITVEEAERRCVTNRTMLRQLQLMRESLYRGYYVLIAFKRRVSVVQDKAQDREVGRHDHYSSFALSQFNPAKRIMMTKNTASDTGRQAEAELQEVLTHLEHMASDMKELVVFLSCYPPLLREPYSMHLWLGNCMFGRQAEQERIISFLLEPEPAGPEDPSVLPVIGQARIGKSTLVEHVCYDDRVRKHFSLIIFVGRSDTGDGSLLPPGDGGVIKHCDVASSGKSLVVLELAGDVDENTWERTLHKLRGEYKVPVSKIVVTSRSEKIASFGTTPALDLKPLPREAYWYYFKTLAFGSTDAEEQPELADVCMEIAGLMNRSFVGANQIGTLLRANPCFQFWRRVLKGFKEHTRMHLRLFGEGPGDLLAKDRPIYLRRLLPKLNGTLIAYRYCTVCSAQQHDLPRITAHDLYMGSAEELQGKFEVLVWRSRIPPYYSYVVNCGVQTPSSALRVPPRNTQTR